MESSHNGDALWCGLAQCASTSYGNALSTLCDGQLLASPRMRGEGKSHEAPARVIALRASESPISTKAEVTSGPPTRMRVGVFILFHS